MNNTITTTIMLIKRFFRASLLVAAFFCLGGGSLFSQITPIDTSDEFNFDKIPADESTSEAAYIGFGGGYQGSLVFMNYDGLNDIARSLGMGEFSGQLFMNGGGGTANAVLVKNLRLGFYAGGGTKELVKDVTVGSEQYQRTLRFGMGFVGVQFDYVLFKFGSLCVIPGVLLGDGSKTLEVFQTQKNAQFQNLFDSAAFNGGTNPNRSIHIANNHLIYYPQVNLEYSPSSFVMMRLGVGYAGSAFGDTWTDDAGTTISNVPDINTNGLRVQFGLFVGLFIP